MKPDSITVFSRANAPDAAIEGCSVKVRAECDDDYIFFLTTAQATALRDDLTKALAANTEADRPKIAPITPGRYRKGNGTIGVVTHIIGKTAIGYSTYDSAPLMASAAEWTLDGAHGAKWGEYPSMDLVEKLD